MSESQEMKAQPKVMLFNVVCAKPPPQEDPAVVAKRYNENLPADCGGEWIVKDGRLALKVGDANE